jgi:hypothetical protein
MRYPLIIALTALAACAVSQPPTESDPSGAQEESVAPSSAPLTAADTTNVSDQEEVTVDRTGAIDDPIAAARVEQPSAADATGLPAGFRDEVRAPARKFDPEFIKRLKAQKQEKAQ